ncbi:hypothetical protein HMPREF1608_02122 [Escherichia coli 908525]|nr:hypothetical protein HMPREF1608_02122 [Escherichia coli 908525]ESD91040.1 hypothetical protein HMPREF1613_01939 [Escherichia coli 908616]
MFHQDNTLFLFNMLLILRGQSRGVMRICLYLVIFQIKIRPQGQ